MKIMAFPAYAHENHYINLLYDGIKQSDVEVVNFNRARMLFSSFDILHIHWPEGLYARKNIITSFIFATITLLSFIILRLSGKKLIWTVHNLKPHDSKYPYLEKYFTQILSSLCNGFIFLGKTSKEQFKKMYNVKCEERCAVIVHGHYRPIYDTNVDPEKSRQILDLPQDKKILLFFGLVRAYKNVDGLVSAFISTAQEDTILLIAGNCPDIGLKERISELCTNHNNIKLHLKFIEDEDVGLYFGAADVVALPYKNILNSGAAFLSLSYNRPVILPETPSMVELKDAIGNDWIYLFKDNINGDDLCKAMQYFETANVFQNQCDLKAFEWDNISSQTIAFYKKIADKTA